MTEPEINFTGLQVAFFFSKPLQNPLGRLALKINRIFGDLFDEMPFVIPLTPNMPSNAPMLELSTSNKEFRCTASKNRADIYYNVLEESWGNSFDYYKSQYDERIKKFCEALQDTEMSVSISRIGYIASYFLKVDKPAAYLQRVFIKDDRLSEGLAELNISFNIAKTISNFKINDMTKLNKAELRVTKESGILIQRDINTDQNEKYSFTPKLFSQFRDFIEPFLIETEIVKLIT